jgi:hypothetical protein
MAKKSARGRTELVHVVHAYDVNLSETTRSPSTVVWRRISRALMSDGVILEKVDIRFEDGQKHSYGWKVKDKSELSPAEFTADYVERGWEVK